MTLISEPVADPIPPRDIKRELKHKYLIGPTKKGGNLIYSINAGQCPNAMNEVGRLRELAFRAAGGGTGKSLDIDHLDTADPGYQQLIVYQPDEEVIIGGYRYIDCSQFCKQANPGKFMSTTHYFDLSEEFINEYLPSTIELGRSWVRPEYQPTSNSRKGLYALANLWDGLGALISKNDHLKYFFGKVTMYPEYDRDARNLLLSFMKFFFEDKNQLVTPKFPVPFKYDKDKIAREFGNLDHRKSISVLRKAIRIHGETIPPLINLYMGLSPTMRVFGTSLNKDFGDVEETAIMVTIEDIDAEKKSRHLP
ncbi:MAG TPA: GNAT family N-acetyltransferase [Bacteroidales bacterium]|nr:GNAT family N-acetyltransferase [Bacteroidales bacterium]